MLVPGHPEADKELAAAALYYESCSPGLGDRFLDEFAETLVRIVESPNRWPSSQAMYASATYAVFRMVLSMNYAKARYTYLP